MQQTRKGKRLPLTPAIRLPCAILYNILSNIRTYQACQVRIYSQPVIDSTNKTGNPLFFL